MNTLHSIPEHNRNVALNMIASDFDEGEPYVVKPERVSRATSKFLPQKHLLAVTQPTFTAQDQLKCLALLFTLTWFSNAVGLLLG